MDRLTTSRASLASAILVAADSESDREILAAGDLPEPIDRASRQYAATRAGSTPRLRTLTPALERWKVAASELSRALGRAPSARELGDYAGHGKTAAHRAMIRLRELEAIESGSVGQTLPKDETP